MCPVLTFFIYVLLKSKPCGTPNNIFYSFVFSRSVRELSQIYIYLPVCVYMYYNLVVSVNYVYYC